MRIDTAEIERIGGIEHGHNPDIAHAISVLRLNELILDEEAPPEQPQGDQEDRWSKLQAENDLFRVALEFYANPKSWWNENVGDRLKYHNANLEGSVERMNAKVGTLEPAGNGNRFVHDQFFNDCGDTARGALKGKRRRLVQPTVVDDDKGEITVTLDGRQLRGWSYKDDAERRQKTRQAHEYVEGWCDGGKV